MAGLFNPFRLFSSNAVEKSASQQSPLAEKKKEKRDDLASHWPRFGVKNFFGYYPFMRLLGYGGSILAPIGVKKLISKVTGETDERELERKTKEAKKIVGRTEAAAFSGWSLFSFFKEKRQLKEQLRNTVAAEFGMNPGRVGLIDLRRSANPLVESTVDKFFSKNAIRFGTDIWFWVNLNFGILMKAIGITAERSVFVQKTAYEQLTGIVHDAWTLNAMSRSELSGNLIRVLQTSFRDHKVRPLDKEMVDNNRELFDKMAQAILEHKMGLAEVVYVMGGIMLKPEDPQLSLQNFNNVLEKGLIAIAKEKYDTGGVSFSEKTTDIKEDKVIPVVKGKKSESTEDKKDSAEKKNENAENVADKHEKKPLIKIIKDGPKPAMAVADGEMVAAR